jgi:hypothetical protein
LKRAPFWSPEQLEELNALAGKKSCAQIGKIVGRTKDAVRHKINELGLSQFALSFEAQQKAKTKPKDVPKKPPLVARFKNHAAAAKKEEQARRQIYHQEPTKIEWCSTCYAPVSNWGEHFERTGHRRA